ncbi:MAG: D-aminoacyl-tRNA deacylase [Candidatus Bipolaricaulota bacterium]
MRIVVQRVKRATVRAGGRQLGCIGEGFVLLVAVGEGDDDQELSRWAKKIPELRVFRDSAGRMNRSLREVEGEILCVSQFTLYGDCRKGRRPSFVGAAPPEQASRDFDRFVDLLRAEGITVRTGEFGAMMELELVNDGPVTLILDRPGGQ